LSAGGADGAVRKRSDGIVIIDPVKAKGRRDLVDACPYGAIVWNEEQQLPQTWIFDAHLLDQGWRAPRCAQVCPTNVFEAVKVSDDDMASRAKRDQLAVLQPELGTRPRVYYRNLHRYTHCFVGGSVFASINGLSECIENATVVLRLGAQVVGRATTDAFGEFRFEGLPPNSGQYEIEITYADFETASLLCALGAASINLGELQLTPKHRE
jgi:NAD-dependent dihydropyrimidine dehydrogenase PreA subunit